MERFQHSTIKCLSNNEITVILRNPNFTTSLQTTLEISFVTNHKQYIIKYSLTLRQVQMH